MVQKGLSGLETGTRLEGSLVVKKGLSGLELETG